MDEVEVFVMHPHGDDESAAVGLFGHFLFLVAAEGDMLESAGDPGAWVTLLPLSRLYRGTYSGVSAHEIEAVFRHLPWGRPGAAQLVILSADGALLAAGPATHPADPDVLDLALRAWAADRAGLAALLRASDAPTRDFALLQLVPRARRRGQA